MKKVLFIVVVLGVAAALYWVRRGDSRTAPVEKTVTVQRGDVVLRATETGSLEPMTVVEIKSEQAGEVKTLHVRAGDVVTAGQTIVTLQQEANQARRIAEARATIEQTRLKAEAAEREQTRMRALFDAGFVARVEREEAERRAESAEIEQDLARRQLLLTLGGNRRLYDQYLRSRLDRAQRPIENDLFTITAPIAGTVLDVKVAEGEIVSSGVATVGGGTTLMRIADLSKMWVKTKINEVNVGQLVEGQAAEIGLDAIPGQRYAAKVVRIPPRGEKENGIVTYEVTLEIANADRRMMPSMTANVDIVVGQEKAALYLPQDAIVEADGKATVTLPGGEKRPVQTGLKNETVVVIADGLKEGDVVVLPEPAPDPSEDERR